jgi:hypothetical protein
MNSDKSNNKLVMNTFISELTNFIELLCTLLPNSKEIQQNKTYFVTCKKVNPRAIIISWRIDVAEHFKQAIEDGDIDFFATHDYENDLNFKDYSNFIVKMFENLKNNIKLLNDENKKTSITYIQNLSKISKLYII